MRSFSKEEGRGDLEDYSRVHRKEGGGGGGLEDVAEFTRQMESTLAVLPNSSQCLFLVKLNFLIIFTIKPSS